MPRSRRRSLRRCRYSRCTDSSCSSRRPDRKLGAPATGRPVRRSKRREVTRSYRNPFVRESEDAFASVFCLGGRAQRARKPVEIHGVEARRTSRSSSGRISRRPIDPRNPADATSPGRWQIQDRFAGACWMRAARSPPPERARAREPADAPGRPGYAALRPSAGTGSTAPAPQKEIGTGCPPPFRLFRTLRSSSTIPRLSPLRTHNIPSRALSRATRVSRTTSAPATGTPSRK